MNGVVKASGPLRRIDGHDGLQRSPSDEMLVVLGHSTQAGQRRRTADGLEQPRRVLKARGGRVDGEQAPHALEVGTPRGSHGLARGAATTPD